MKLARRSFLGVLLGLLLLAMFLVLHAQAASQVSPASSILSLSPATSVHEKIINADSLVYWRSNPDWNTPLTIIQQGISTGDTVALACYMSGSVVPYASVSLWYWAEVVAGHSKSSGWMNGYFLNTGTNQPNAPVDGVIACPPSPYIWSDSEDGAGILAIPGDGEIDMPGGSVLEFMHDSRDLTQVEIGPFCWIDGGWTSLGNYPTNRWFQVSPYDTLGVNDHGYINASLVANQRPTPHCDEASVGNPVTRISTVTLAQGSRASDGSYSFMITLAGFPRSLDSQHPVTISVECYDSKYRDGFYQFTIPMDSYGSGSSQNTCSGGSSDLVDHWVVAGWITSNHIRWGGGSTNNPQSPAVAKVTLTRGPAYSGNIYYYAITLSGFPANTSISVECYDSVSPSGFRQFTITTDGSGNASIQNECYSGDGPDHWVVAGGVISNYVQWGGGGTNNPPPPPPSPSPPPPPPPPPPSPPPPPPSPPPPPTHSETVGGVAHTWTNYSNAGGNEGPSIAAYQTVQISCKVTGFKVQDGDTWWYRIASSPWNNAYYVSADAFYNDGATSGSLQGTPFVDPAVPNC